ncbi:MAG: PDZ domain-containing protein [Planctomycetota bacterium]
MNRTLSISLLLLALAGPALAQDQDLSRDLAVAKAREEARMAMIEKVSRCFVAIGGGSGIIISPEGEILTNHHVAGSRPVGSIWFVVRPGGKFQKAKLIATDPRGDITLLKLEEPGPYPYVEMADSDAIVVGQAVIALGNPFGFSKDGSPNVTTGLISAVHRYQGGYSDAIQTDTAINPGNSGGPLLDFQGRLLGINGRIAVRFGTRANTGVGYAIPSNQIKSFLPFFRKGGVVGHGVIRGLRLEETDQGGDGAQVRGVRSGTPAERAGLQPGDRIVAAGGRAVSSPRRFEGIVGTYPSGETIQVKVVRGGRELSVDLYLEARDGEATAAKSAYLGVRLSSHEGGGAEVEEVVAGSPAARSGLQTGDVVKELDGAKIKDVAQMIELLGKCQAGQTITLGIERNGEVQQLKVQLGERQGR